MADFLVPIRYCSWRPQKFFAHNKTQEVSSLKFHKSILHRHQCTWTVFWEARYFGIDFASTFLSLRIAYASPFATSRTSPRKRNTPWARNSDNCLCREDMTYAALWCQLGISTKCGQRQILRWLNIWKRFTLILRFFTVYHHLHVEQLEP